MQPTNVFVVSSQRLHPLVASLVGLTFFLPLACCIAAGLHGSDGAIIVPSSLTAFAARFGTLTRR